MTEIIRLNLACNQNCLFCNTKGKNEPEPHLTVQQAKRKILTLKKNRLMFSGGEPTINKHLLELIAFAKNNKFKNIGIQTNAMMCSYNEYVRKLKVAGLTEAFVPFHSHQEKVFDWLTRTPNSYKKTICGIHNLINEKIKVKLNIVINSKNYKGLLDTLKFIGTEFKDLLDYNKGSKREGTISFSFVQPHGLAWRNKWIVPRMSDVEPYVHQAMKFCEENKIPFNNPSCGLPLCFVRGYEKNSMEYEIMKNKNRKRYSELKRNKKDKIKGPQCSKCKLNKYCLGVWKAYAEIYGLKELKPQ